MIETDNKSMEKQIVFSTSIAEANLIIKALSNMPFKDVFEIIGKLNQQANEQLRNGTTPEH